MNVALTGFRGNSDFDDGQNTDIDREARNAPDSLGQPPLLGFHRSGSQTSQTSVFGNATDAQSRRLTSLLIFTSTWAFSVLLDATTFAPKKAGRSPATLHREKAEQRQKGKPASAAVPMPSTRSQHRDAAVAKARIEPFPLFCRSSPPSSQWGHICSPSRRLIV